MPRGRQAAQNRHCTTAMESKMPLGAAERQEVPTAPGVLRSAVLPLDSTTTILAFASNKESSTMPTMTKGDSQRIQSSQAKNGRDMSSSGFASRAQSAGDRHGGVASNSKGAGGGGGGGAGKGPSGGGGKGNGGGGSKGSGKSK
ncbi:hypothetical protein MKEN_00448500 [Mycena kentingensis (nom. inval.)]|nr:hypothetical protein MKEN_00448500 [Mycena kentingensis (nom. inval.)]